MVKTNDLGFIDLKGFQDPYGRFTHTYLVTEVKLGMGVVFTDLQNHSSAHCPGIHCWRNTFSSEVIAGKDTCLHSNLDEVPEMSNRYIAILAWFMP